MENRKIVDVGFSSCKVHSMQTTKYQVGIRHLISENARHITLE